MSASPTFDLGQCRQHSDPHDCVPKLCSDTRAFHGRTQASSAFFFARANASSSSERSGYCVAGTRDGLNYSAFLLPDSQPAEELRWDEQGDRADCLVEMMPSGRLRQRQHPDASRASSIRHLRLLAPPAFLPILSKSDHPS
jgi:hypothetical protein